MIFWHRLGYRIWRQIRFFFQRVFRGWDDSETWSLDISFYEWLLPRFKRFIELTNGYPEEYGSFEEWREELTKRLKQLERIIENSDIDYEFDDLSYIPEKELDKLWANEHLPLSAINVIAYGYMAQDFHQWFADNINKLWW